MGYYEEVLADSPLAYYRLGEATGVATSADSSGNARSITWTGSPVAVAGLLNTSTDGARDPNGGYASRAKEAWMDLSTFTVEAWIKLDSVVAGAGIVERYGGGQTGVSSFLLYMPGGKITFAVRDNGGDKSAAAAAAAVVGTTYHIVGTYDGSNVRLYINGSLVATTPATGAPSGNAALTVGRTVFNGLVLDGAIDEVAIYGTALSATRITAHYDAAIATAATTASLAATLPQLGASFTVIPHIPPVQTATTNRSSGILFGGRGYVDSEPAIIEPPAHLQRGHDYVKAQAYTAPVVSDKGAVILEPVYAEAKRHRDRIIVGGKDVTFFRDVRTPMPSFRLTQPHGYGATTLVFPQTHAAFERFGQGALSWLDKERRVRFQRINVDTGLGEGIDYMGVITAVRVQQVSLDGASKLCWVADVGGDLSGRASLRDQQPPLFRWVRDIARHVHDKVRALGLRVRPADDIGIDLARQGGMSDLDWLNELCAWAVKKDGTHYTLMPALDNDRVWEFRAKDTTTRHATVYFDSGNVVPDLVNDIAEQPTHVFMTGTTPEGMKVKNGRYPGLKQAEAPAYPFGDGRTFGVGDSLAGATPGSIEAMNWRLIGAKYLDQRDDVASFTQATADAVERLQEEAKLPVTGRMDPATWDALFDLSVTGYSLRQSQIEPMAQATYVRKWNRTASGARASRNTDFDPTRLEVHKSVDAGSGHSIQSLFRWARQERVRSIGNNWVGTIKVNIGAVVRGDHTPGTPLTAANVMPLRELRPGMNVWAPLFNGGTLFHIVGVDVDEGGKTGTLTVDTKYRDLLTVAEIIARNRDSRRDPARAYLNQNRKRGPIDSLITFDEVGGLVYDNIVCPANEWTVFPVVAGQEGTIRQLEIQTSGAPAAFVVSVWGRNPGKHNLAAKIGNPFPLDADGLSVWAQDLAFFEDELLLYSAGDEDQPCGYWPKPHTNADGIVTEHPVTGKWHHEAQFSYHTGTHPVLWVAIYPDRDTAIAPQRIMWPQLEEGS